MAKITRDTAQYISQENVQPSLLGGPPWNLLYDIGDKVPASGIYRCHGCGHEITSNSGDGFPPQNRHQHADPRVAVQWRLIVRTETK